MSFIFKARLLNNTDLTDYSKIDAVFAQINQLDNRFKKLGFSEHKQKIQYVK